MSSRTLKVVSPLHIGNGRELTPLDVYPENGLLHVLDTTKLTEDLLKLGAPIEEILYLLRNPPGDTYIWKGYIQEFHLDPSDYVLYTLRVHGEAGKKSMQIKEFIKTNGKPYIPGSSVKGALRTAVFYRVLKECGDSRTAMNVVSRLDRNLAKKIGWSESLLDFYLGYIQEEIERRSQRRRRFDTKKADDLLEAIVFGMKPDRHLGVGYEPKRDPLRALIVRDSREIGRKHLTLYRVDVAGNPQPIPIWVEGLEPGTTTEVEITVDRELLKLNGNEFNGLLWECLRERGEPWKAFEDFLWDAVNEFYSDVIREELKETGKFGKWAKDVRVFYSSLEGYEGHVLRLGWGSGWPSTTIGVLLGKERKWERARKMLGLGRKPGGGGFSREFPKTRRIAGGMPMGWVVLE